MTKKNNEEQTKEKTAQEEEVISIPLDNIEDDTSALAQRKADEYKDHLQRLQAEFDNYRKRTAENSRQSRSDGICDVIAELLPAIDNLERGIGAVADTSAKSG
ncbi:MAG: nucleotide exchange factor GrpE, partial [Clostridia bacterium]|nr:nucleotide exchange factor GrpE [Clostridia bacterium]